MKESEMFRANKILEENKRKLAAKKENVAKVLEILKKLDDNERAIVVEVLHDNYKLTYIEDTEGDY